MRIRTATPDDAEAISRVRVDTWRVAYDGLVPAAVLDGLDAERESTSRRARLQQTDGARRRDLVAEVDGEVVGFAAAGRSRDNGDDDIGELYALYVLPAHWSTGIGHALLEAAEARLRAAGLDRAVLWVLATNDRAARFYTAHGWLPDGATKADATLGGATGWVADEVRRVKALV